MGSDDFGLEANLSVLLQYRYKIRSCEGYYLHSPMWSQRIRRLFQTVLGETSFLIY